MQCIDKCGNDKLYKYEFGNEFCLKNFSDSKIYSETKKLIKFPQSDNSKINDSDFMIFTFQESIINGSFNNSIKTIIEERIDYVVHIKNITYQVTTTDNQKNSNRTDVSSIDLGNCETTLREIYGLNNSTSPLIIFKIDYYIPGILIPVVEYEVYHPKNNSKLNLSYCNDTININPPAEIDENKIDLYYPYSDYYQDACSSYSFEEGIDTLLYDRKKAFINNNYSLCEINCNYQGYNFNTKRSNCSCKIKNDFKYVYNLSNNSNVLSQVFDMNEEDLGYIDIFSCKNKLLSINKLTTNPSNYILIGSLFFSLLIPIFFVKCGYSTILTHINDIISQKMEFDTTQINRSSIFQKGKIKNKNCKYNKNGFGLKRLSKFNHNKKINYPPKRINNRMRSFSLQKYNNSSGKEINNIKNQIVLNLNCSKNMKSNNLKHNSLLQTSINKPTNDRIGTYKTFKDSEMNSFNYLEAVCFDKRSCCQYYISLIKLKQILIFAFCPGNDYNSRIIKICIFILSFNIHYAINFVYFLKQENIQKVFENKGKYDLNYFLPYIGISFAISHFIIIIIKLIFLSDSDIIEIKKQKEINLVQNTSTKIKRKLKIKYTMFFVFGIIFHFFLWLILSSFSIMFANTSQIVLKNALLAFGISLIYPFFFNIIPCIFRIPSLRGKKKDHNIIYNISKFFQAL